MPPELTPHEPTPHDDHLDRSAEGGEVDLGRSPDATIPPVGERPDRRSRRSAVVAGVYTFFAAGVVLFGSVLISPDTAGANVATVLAAAATVLMGAALLAELADPRPIAAVGLVGGAVLGISALWPEAIEGPEVGRLLAGAMLFLSSAAILTASISRRDRGGDR